MMILLVAPVCLSILTGSTTSALVAPAVASLSSSRSRLRLDATFTVTVDMPEGKTATFPCADDEFILDAAEDAGLELPSSCRSGACTSCQGRVLSGKFSMEEQSTLEDEHIEAGYVCTCIAYPESDIRIVTHQMDNFENGVMTFDDAPASAAPAPAPAAPAPAPAPAPAAAATPAASGIDGAKLEIAKKTLAVLSDLVAGDSALEAKCSELAALLDGGGGGGEADSAAEADYIPYKSEDTGYTIWLNKNNPRNSWYEYHKK